MNKTIIIETLTHTRIANLNRDDLGEVKRAGDRIRISSQCLKRHIRQLLNEYLGDKNAIRSKLIPGELKSRAIAEGLVDERKAGKAIEGYFSKAKGKSLLDKSTHELTTLVFLSQEEIESMYEGFVEHIKNPKSGTNALDALKLGEKRYGFIVSLFGRMFADEVSLNVEGAAGVKHAYTVQAQEAEKDFFTAVDDKKVDDKGSGHLGVSEFASGDFYSCIHLNINLLASNLGLDMGSEELKSLVENFLKAVINSFPQAKHNTNLANNLPYYVSCRVVKGFACTNDDAFAEPVTSMNQEEVVSRLRAARSAKDNMHEGTGYSVVGTWEAFNSPVKTMIEETIKHV